MLESDTIVNTHHKLAPTRLNKKIKFNPKYSFDINSTVNKLEKISAAASASNTVNAFDIFGKSVAS